MRTTFRRLCREFVSDRQGIIPIIFALTVIPVAGLTAAAIDFAQGTRSRSEITAIADAATVAAASEQIVKPSMTLNEQLEAARAAVEREFAGQIAVREGVWRMGAINYKVDNVDTSIRVSLCFEAEQDTMFLKIAGIASLQLTNCSVAQSAPPTYVSVYALIDASGSMGIGATYQDQALMEQRLGCAFACHTINDVNDSACNTAGSNIPRSWWSQTPKCAKIIGARTRFDVVRDAMIRVTEQAERLSRVTDQYRLSVHKFSNYLTEVHASSTSMPQARSALQNMTMDQRGAGTNFYKVMADFARLIPESGDGKSARTPKVFVLLLTDGIGSRVFEENRCFFGGSAPCRFEGGWRQDPDYVLESPFVDGGIRSQAFPSRLCDALKTKKATVLTLATEFDSTNINDGHMKNVDRTLRGRSLSGLSGCASATNLAYKANLAPDVESAINQMFTAVIEKARLVR